MESQALALDFPVAGGVQDVLEGGRGGGPGPLGTVAVLDSRSSRGSPRHTGVLGGPATMSMRWGFFVDMRTKLGLDITTISGTACSTLMRG